MDSPKFSQFNVTATPYKTINGQEIPLHVMIPKDVNTGKHPVVIHFHGGFLVSGHAMFPDWAAQWALDYAVQHSAIRISANYRLLPESNGLDIVSDARDVLSWVEKDLEAYLRSIGSDVTPDLEQVITYGESAGGYLALLSGLMRPGLVKAIIAAYPMTYVNDPWYSVASDTKSPMGAPQIPKEVLDQYLATVTPNSTVTGAFPPDRMPLALVMLQQGLFPQFMGTDDSVSPPKVLEKFEGRNAPYLYILHGKQDSAVPYPDSAKFLAAWKEKFGNESAIGKFEDGDHGFDTDATLETVWMKDGLKGVTKAWIG